MYRAEGGIIICNFDQYKSQKSIWKMFIIASVKYRSFVFVYPFYQIDEFPLKTVPLVQLHYKSSEGALNHTSLSKHSTEIASLLQNILFY